ncbi:hypothetical protein HQ865_00280 [Mucilaginibacter mali]|uniref:Uncharacterized protein n=1 Tax=Mucilaginibacter mali TaxID=2740462 RepID=A0A7D4UBN0_9SPHI|nr:hypothetical protein [Mucilaginibacter mali]QKJ28259.1 hypothetical protein HQ865_00280 [Mucilaginibacter mali]
MGTQGVGIEGKMNVVERLDVRLGASIIPINSITSTQYLGSNRTTINLQPRFSNVHLLADWRPFKFSGSNPLSGNFKLTAGGAYFIRSEGTANISLADSYFYGDIELPKEDIGVVTATAKWSHFAPYGGLGLDNIPVFNNFMIGFEMGTYYISNPSASIVGTNFLVDNDQNGPKLQSNLKSYQFMPVFQVNFNFKIK